MSEQTSAGVPAANRTVTVTQRERYLFLDGLRGWAALAVVLCHCFIEVFAYSPGAAKFLAYLAAFNGTVAVFLFFIISGFSLSIAYIQSGNRRGLARLAVSRYPRLALPIFAACTVVAAAMATGVIYSPELRPPPLNTALLFAPSFFHVLQFSFWDVFFRFRLQEAYILPLWTMSIELYGSAIVIVMVATLGRWRHRLWAYGGLSAGLAAFSSIYCLFPAGVLLAELHVRGNFHSSRWQLIMAGVFLLGLLTPWLNGPQPSFFYLASMVGLCASAAWLRPLRGFFQCRFSCFLGRISFPLYLVHGPLLYSFSLWVLNVVQSLGLTHGAANLVVAIATVPAAALAAVAFAPVNEIAIALSRRFGVRVVNVADRILGKAFSEKSPAPAASPVASDAAS